jgi:hypothetical protein
MKHSLHVPREYHKQAILRAKEMLKAGCEVIAVSDIGCVLREGTEELSILDHPTDGLHITYSYEE